ncbi:MAG TPA: glycosyltransferase family 2 protein, partial [Pyrinomonadaceae bacterium]|nr:glycosyltransferase family 2 protein [Pyrinomonadaceae bacterium]
AVAAEHFRAMNGFDERFRTSEDREFCDRWLARGARLAYAPDALVRHAHPLTLRTLWRQHFDYGRGARRVHRAREARGHGRFKPDLAFYLKLLREPLMRAQKLSRAPESPRAQTAPAAAKMLALLLWSQLANTAGFFSERS